MGKEKGEGVLENGKSFLKADAKILESKNKES